MADVFLVGGSVIINVIVKVVKMSISRVPLLNVVAINLHAVNMSSISPIAYQDIINATKLSIVLTGAMKGILARTEVAYQMITFA